MYKTTTIPNLAEGEHGYQLDTGEYLAVTATIQRDAVHHQLSCIVKARQVDSSGAAIEDGNGVPVHTSHTHSTTVEYLPTLGGQNGLVLQTLKIVLGEPDAIADVNDNIRAAIAAAAATTPAFDLSALG